MTFKFLGDIAELKSGINILSDRLGYIVSDNGDYEITAVNKKGDLKVIKSGKNVTIEFDQNCHFFRALGLLAERISEDSFEICETPQFKTIAVMFDASRCMVPTVDYVKEQLKHMAIMGMNSISLYTEDIYEIDDEPYFGYMRGRYTKEELKECDDFAYDLGIEMIPFIQTLGHMEQFFQWPASKKYQDTDKTFLADDEEVYKFIEKEIASVSSCHRTKRIHVGMDEAVDLGTGRYLAKNGYHKNFDIMNRHVERVSAIAEKYGLKPIVASDMYETFVRDENNDPAVVAKTAPNAELLMWDYYRETEDTYVEKINLHKLMGRMPIFTGGIWTWTGFGCDYEKTMKTTLPALSACKKEGVSEILATVWCNDTGSAFPPGLMGMCLFAELGYMEEFDLEKFKKRVKFCTGIDYEDFCQLTKLYKIPGLPYEHEEPPNPASSILWQDVMMGLYDAEIKGLEITEHFKKCSAIYHELMKKSDFADLVFAVPAAVSDVNVVKGEMGLKLKEAYDNGDRETLADIANNGIPKVIELVEKLRTEHRRVFFAVNKPFGFDLRDLRYGGVLTRLETAKWRINDYLEGKCDRLEELEQERLPFDHDGSYFLRWRKYTHIATPHTERYSMG